MAKQLSVKPAAGELMESVFVEGDYSRLSADERVRLIVKTCKSLGLNPLTRPLEFIKMPNGKIVMYAKRDCTDQLRKIHNISVEITKESYSDGLYRVSARAETPNGRRDEDRGVVAINEKLAGDFRANLELKAVTKAKRRVTLSICGLGFLDETEVEDIPDAAPVYADDRAAYDAALNADLDRDPIDHVEPGNSEVPMSGPAAPAVGDSAAAAGALSVEDMAREAAKRGPDQLRMFFNKRSSDEKKRLRKIEAELVALYPPLTGGK